MNHDRTLRASHTSNDSLDSPSTLVPASESMYEPSEATTLYEKDLSDTSSRNDGVKPEAEYEARRNSFNFNERWSADPFKAKSDWPWGADQYPSKESSSSTPTRTPLHNLKEILSSLVGLFKDYKTRKKLLAIDSRVNSCRRNYHPLSVKELQTAYVYLRELARRRHKFTNNALTLRLSVLELLFDMLDHPVLFTEQRQDFFHQLWLDLDFESSRADIKPSTYQQISGLKYRFFLRILDELPIHRSISEIIPDGPSAVEALCKELAYGPGAYSIQKMLKQIATTDWGHKELLRLSPQPYLKDDKGESKFGTNVIIDCIMKLLSFKNGFSHAMAFRIFGRLAEYNQEVHALLAGPTGVIWLANRLDDETYKRSFTYGYRSSRRVETYCHALMAACTKGFMDCVLECNVVSTLLCWIEIFTVRDEAMHSMIEDNLQDDWDVELDQIACCDLIILLMKTPSGKKQFLINEIHVLEAFMNHPNRSFSDWKLSLKLTTIERLLRS